MRLRKKSSEQEFEAESLSRWRLIMRIAILHMQFQLCDWSGFCKAGLRGTISKYYEDFLNGGSRKLLYKIDFGRRSNLIFPAQSFLIPSCLHKDFYNSINPFWNPCDGDVKHVFINSGSVFILYLFSRHVHCKAYQIGRNPCLTLEIKHSLQSLSVDYK